MELEKFTNKIFEENKNKKKMHFELNQKGLDFFKNEFNPKNISLQSALERNTWKKQSFDLTITSPPYNVDVNYGGQKDNISYKSYLKFSKIWLQNVYYWTKDTGRLCLNIPLDKNKLGKQSVGADFTILARNCGWNYQTTIIWNESNISKRTAWGSWLSASAPSLVAPVELILVFSKGEWKKQNKGISTISKKEFMEWVLGLWTFHGESAKKIGHPAPFPRELPKRCIKLFSYLGDAVFDPFSGSGTTLIEAVDNGRRAFGNEINKAYRKQSLKRIKKELQSDRNR